MDLRSAGGLVLTFSCAPMTTPVTNDQGILEFRHVPTQRPVIVEAWQGDRATQTTVTLVEGVPAEVRLPLP